MALGLESERSEAESVYTLHVTTAALRFVQARRQPVFVWSAALRPGGFAVLRADCVPPGSGLRFEPRKGIRFTVGHYFLGLLFRTRPLAADAIRLLFERDLPTLDGLVLRLVRFPTTHLSLIQTVLPAGGGGS